MGVRDDGLLLLWLSEAKYSMAGMFSASAMPNPMGISGPLA